MKLGIFLSLGSSFTDQKKSGQDKRFIDYYLKKYNKVFAETDIFSYTDEEYKLPQKCLLIANKWKINRFLYSLVLPILHFKKINKIDVFRVMQFTGVISAILTKIFLKKPFVFTYGYDYMAFAKLEGQIIRPILLKILEKLAVKFASAIIITNKRIENKLKIKYPQCKLVYIPNGVDINKFKPSSSIIHPRQSAGRHSLSIKILFVGRLEKQKNLFNLIKAVSLLNKKYLISLLFIGQGKEKNQLIRLAKKLRIDLKIISKVPYDRIVKYYQQADIFVLPSFLEGHPKALLEAMACGLPCLVGRYPGIEEFENKKEVLTAGFSAEEIGDSLSLLIEDHHLRKILGFNSRLRIEKDFNIDNLIAKELTLLQNV